MAKKISRLIDADKILEKAGFKMPSKKVLVMQEEILEGERIAKRGKMPNPLEMERVADQFRKDELSKIR